MWRVLQHHQPAEFVDAKGESHSVQEFCELAFGHDGLNWQGHVRINARFEHPSEVGPPLG